MGKWAKSSFRYPINTQKPPKTPKNSHFWHFFGHFSRFLQFLYIQFWPTFVFENGSNPGQNPKKWAKINFCIYNKYQLLAIKPTFIELYPLFKNRNWAKNSHNCIYNYYVMDHNLYCISSPFLKISDFD